LGGTRCCSEPHRCGTGQRFCSHPSKVSREFSAAVFRISSRSRSSQEISISSPGLKFLLVRAERMASLWDPISGSSVRLQQRKKQHFSSDELTPMKSSLRLSCLFLVHTRRFSISSKHTVEAPWACGGEAYRAEAALRHQVQMMEGKKFGPKKIREINSWNLDIYSTNSRILVI